jgi:pyruvate dehydrogenase E2 component (dihydrolipoamide acetyltransferase)
MLIEIKRPDLSTTDEDVTVVQWLVEVGQSVRRGQPLLEVRTDKATMEVESFVSGVLREVLVGPEGNVDVGQVIARVESEAGVSLAVTASAGAGGPPAAGETPPPGWLATASPRGRWTATTSWRSTRPPARPRPNAARAAGPSSWNS